MHHVIGLNDYNIMTFAQYWFSGGGICLCQDTVTLEYKAYIKSIEGSRSDIDNDIQHILAHGSKFPLKAALELLPEIEIIQGKNYVKEKHPELLVGN